MTQLLMAQSRGRPGAATQPVTTRPVAPRPVGQMYNTGAAPVAAKPAAAQSRPQLRPYNPSDIANHSNNVLAAGLSGLNLEDPLMDASMLANFFNGTGANGYLKNMDAAQQIMLGTLDQRVDPVQAANAGFNAADASGFKLDQRRLIEDLFNVANGNAPTEAEIMLGRTRTQNANDALSQTASIPGLSPAMRAKLAANATATANATAAFDTSRAANQERLNQRNLIGQLLSGARGQDEALSSFNAGAANDMSRFNAGLTQQSNLANADIQSQDINRRLGIGAALAALAQQRAGNMLGATQLALGGDQQQQQINNQPTGLERILMSILPAIGGGLMSGVGAAMIPRA